MESGLEVARCRTRRWWTPCRPRGWTQSCWRWGAWGSSSCRFSEGSAGMHNRTTPRRSIESKTKFSLKEKEWRILKNPPNYEINGSCVQEKPNPFVPFAKLTENAFHFLLRAINFGWIQRTSSFFHHFKGYSWKVRRSVFCGRCHLPEWHIDFFVGMRLGEPRYNSLIKLRLNLASLNYITLELLSLEESLKIPQLKNQARDQTRLGVNTLTHRFQN